MRTARWRIFGRLFFTFTYPGSRGEHCCWPKKYASPIGHYEHDHGPWDSLKMSWRKYHLELLLSWRKNTDLKHACSYAMGAQRAQNNVLNVTSKSFKRPQSHERERQRPDSLSNSSQSSISEQQCFLCGYEYPHKGECPAKGKRCSNCGKANHFKKMCKSGSNNNSSNSRSNYNNNRSNHHGTNDRTPNNNFNRYGGSPTRSMQKNI